ncbi:MAG: hypothetical protein Q8O67_26120 [Deltaproteobacteria bacterium]|nr:hypothetical protein [Deltaproteobacteria bacterium]
MFVWPCTIVLLAVAHSNAVRAQSPPLTPDASAPADAPLIQETPPQTPPETPAPGPPAAPPALPVSPPAFESVSPPETPVVVQAPPAPAAPLQTRWEPFDREAARTADGSLDVCSTMVFPLTLIPGVGDVVGTVGDWLCIIPAAIAVDYTGAFHGGHESHIWQPTLALVLKKVWETLLDTPIAVVVIGVLIGGVVGGTALSIYSGLPGTLVSAGVVGLTLATYLGLKGARDGVGDFIFEFVYEAFTPEVEGEKLVEVQKSSFLQPGVSGVPAGFGLIATVAGSKPTFDWAYAVPVAGPIWRSEAHARGIQRRVRRYAHEVLLVDKKDLSRMDATADVLATTQGYSFAAAHLAIGAAVGFFGAGVIVSLSDNPQSNPNTRTGDVLGIIGLSFAVVGGAAVVVGVAADKLQPVLVPSAFALAE